MNRGFSERIIVVIVALFAVLAVGTSLFLEIGSEIQNANYQITTDDGIYFVNSYTKEQRGQCVYMAEKEIRFCGNWTVEKLNKE